MMSSESSRQSTRVTVIDSETSMTSSKA
jgi:hypothetical protein